MKILKPSFPLYKEIKKTAKNHWKTNFFSVAK